jgi:hypothetical protein
VGGLMMGRDELLRLLREDAEVQGAILGLLSGALQSEESQPASSPLVPTERRRPDWVLNHPGVRERLEREAGTS